MQATIEHNANRRVWWENPGDNAMMSVLFRSVLDRSCVETAPAQVRRRPGCMTRPVQEPQAHCSLHQLKRKLLQEALQKATCMESYKRLCGAANEAASLAWSTDQPLLVFPCLFEELAEGREKLGSSEG